MKHHTTRARSVSRPEEDVNPVSARKKLDVVTWSLSARVPKVIPRASGSEVRNRNPTDGVISVNWVWSSGLLQCVFPWWDVLPDRLGDPTSRALLRVV